jgi:hypothetical protein
MAMEQLPFLPSRRSRTGTGERGMGKDFISASGGLASQLPAFVAPAVTKRLRSVVPSFAKAAKLGQPSVMMVSGKDGPAPYVYL